MDWLLSKKPSRSSSMAPERASMNEHEVPQIFRTFSYQQRRQNTGEAAAAAAADETLFRTASNTYDFNAVETSPAVDQQQTEAREETLVTVRGATVHLVDEDGSPMLGQGDFSVVRIEQEGNGIVAFVRVGDQLRWPLTQDEPAIKLDSSHYYFTIRVPRSVDHMVHETTEGDEPISYGVTFADVNRQERQLQEVDSVLERYSNFSKPQLVHGQQQQIVPENRLQVLLLALLSPCSIDHSDYGVSDMHGACRWRTAIKGSFGERWLRMWTITTASWRRAWRRARAISSRASSWSGTLPSPVWRMAVCTSRDE